MRTRSSQIAETLGNRLVGVRSHRSDAFRLEYRNASKQFPALLLASGLASAWAFAEARRANKDSPFRDAWSAYLDDICLTLRDVTTRCEFETGLAALANATYRQRSREVMTAADTLKRFASALWDDLDRTSAEEEAGEATAEVAETGSAS